MFHVLNLFVGFSIFPVLMLCSCTIFNFEDCFIPKCFLPVSLGFLSVVFKRQRLPASCAASSGFRLATMALRLLFNVHTCGLFHSKARLLHGCCRNQTVRLTRDALRTGTRRNEGPFRQEVPRFPVGQTCPLTPSAHRCLVAIATTHLAILQSLKMKCGVQVRVFSLI